jgi:hypothetical protein
MSIWRVGAQAVVELTHWQVLEIPSIDREGRDRHFSGCAERQGDPGRVSSRIVSFNHRTMTGTTRSGREYQLVGPPGGRRGDPDYVWAQWASFNKVDPKKVSNVTGEYA